jgi:hypothetical protein
MSSGAAERLARALEDNVQTQAAVIDALPALSRVVVVVQFAAVGTVKHVRISTETDSPVSVLSESMGKGTAGRLIRALSAGVMARELLVRALAPGSRVTLVVEFGQDGQAHPVRFSTESGASAEMGLSRVPNGRHS